MWRVTLPLCGGLLLGCQTQHQLGNSSLDRYRESLSRGELQEAYALTSREHRAGESFEEFQRRHSSATDRARVVAELGAVDRLQGDGGVTVVKEGEDWRVTEPSREVLARAALTQFLEAAMRGDFEAAYLWLAPEWRARYTPRTLAADFGAEPLAKERLERAHAHRAAPLRWEGVDALLPVGTNSALRLVPEGPHFRVAGLE